MLTTAMISGHYVILGKNKHSRDRRHAGKSHGGGGVNGSSNPDGRGTLNQKIHPQD